SDDPRLSGTSVIVWNKDIHVIDGPLRGIRSVVEDIRGEGRGWTCHSPAVLDGGADFFASSIQGSELTTCVGDGANEGLTALLVVTSTNQADEFEGLIFPGDLPPLPSLGSGDPIDAPDTTSADDDADSPGADATEVDEELPEVATVTDVAVVDNRTRDLTIASPAVGTKMARLILPAGFDEQPERTWPVLYLLHGQGGSHLDWTRDTSIARRLGEELDALIVMPDADAGYYSDWWNGGEGGQPMWETFHIDELRRILEADWRAGDRRAIAGISMGGFGAMSYAARHPDLFAAAASFSGVLDPYGSDWGYDAALWGDKTDQAEVWQAHDPVSLAPALADTALYVWWGDGREEVGGPVVDGLEAYLAPHSAMFVERLEELGIEATVESGPGVHDWASWDDAVLRALPTLRSALEGQQLSN
ncbi:MAG: alpha/beta hydrolase family protein, partial [Candidatus Limnocylindrales bacterium]